MKNSLSIYLLIVVHLLIAGSLPARAQTVPSEPSHVYVSGHQLLVQKRLADGTLDVARPYVIKGVTWQPATISPANGPDPLDPTQTVPYGCFDTFGGQNPPGYVVFNYWIQNQFAAHYTQDIPLIQQLNANTVRIFGPLASDAQTSKQILDAFYEAGIMVIMTVVNSSQDVSGVNPLYLTSVQQVMNHPAILMWVVGNEWNLNNYYGSYSALSDEISVTTAAVQGIHQIDPNHPVSSSLGDVLSVAGNTIPTILAGATNVDLWGLNSYRGESFGSLFTDWAALTSKPFYLGEFGIDSFNTTAYSICSSASCTATNEAIVTAGTEDQSTQSVWDLALWNEISGQLSAFSTQAPCMGGNVFAFNNELWEVGDYNVNLGGLPDNTGDCTNTAPNPGGFYLPGASPDNVTNEEYFGIVNADRSPKLAYANLAGYYQSLAPLNVPVISYVNPPSAPAGGTSFTLTITGSHFTSDCFVFWNGASRQATYVSPTQLEVAVTASDLAQTDNVNLFVVDPSTTGAASSLFTFPIQAISSDSAARISPSPWRSDRHSGVPITFDQLTPGSTVKIFTLSGRWVRSLSAAAGFVNWDLTNSDGHTVASGIYLYLITDNQGATTRGKLGIIR